MNLSLFSPSYGQRHGSSEVRLSAASGRARTETPSCPIPKPTVNLLVLLSLSVFFQEQTLAKRDGRSGRDLVLLEVLPPPLPFPTEAPGTGCGWVYQNICHTQLHKTRHHRLTRMMNECHQVCELLSTKMGLLW